MDKMIVAVFDNETKAYEGVKTLKDLHAEGSITLYEAAVVAKDANGKISVKQADDEGPLGTLVGLATGSLIGLLGGPVGLAVGAATGVFAGSVYDLAQLGVGSDFVDEVSQHLAVGKMAVVGHVDEEWVTPLDTRIAALGGAVVRRTRDEFVDAQFERDIAADKAELAALKAEHAKAIGEAKARLQAKIDATQKRLQHRRDQLKDWLAASKREDEARIKSIEEQAAKAKGEMKAKLEARGAKARADHKARAEKLSKAWELVKEAAAI
jgi:uncharacterized membrane protein